MDRSKKYTLLRVSGRFVKLLAEGFKQWRLYLVYAAILTVLSAIFCQWSYSCNGSAKQFWCYTVSSEAKAFSLGLVFVFINIFTYMSFAYDFYEKCFLNGVFKWQNIFLMSVKKLKGLGFLLLYIICFLGCMLISWIILKKPANPDWHVEFVFFLMLFVMVVIPFAAMRFSASVAYFLNEEKKIPWKKIYENTKERSYIGIIMFLFILLLSVALLLHCQVILLRLTLGTTIFTLALGAEYCGYLIKLFCVTAFMAFFRAQYEMMEDQEDSEDVPVVAVEEKQPSTTKQKKKNKKSRKK